MEDIIAFRETSMVEALALVGPGQRETPPHLVLLDLTCKPPTLTYAGCSRRGGSGPRGHARGPDRGQLRAPGGEVVTRVQAGADHVLTLDTTRPDVVEGDCSCSWWTAQATVRLVEAAHRGHLEGLAGRGDL